MSLQEQLNRLYGADSEGGVSRRNSTPQNLSHSQREVYREEKRAEREQATLLRDLRIQIDGTD